MKLIFKRNVLVLICFLTALTCFSQEEESIDVPFVVLEEIPMFPNCINVERSEGKNCFMQEMNNHIAQNFKYPRKAAKKNIQGRVTVMFVINYQGDIINIKTKAPVGCELLAAEAERIIKLLPKFKPGMQKGSPVSVSYAQPIVFKLK
ncbi:energy transducer TonB [uncultured Flavobacterium sp.]|uniref:energy transducer TonB n=1 Tax=uncultured Flavobacterium sp. TaxID=165435 RepID=UPI0030EF014D|tara:strand:- start:640 stop:1083 length:444 start_codon:yes stop_codon:yes gene_type:complete